jgi:murein L,D-transpeptidase YcbB/YkuD
MARGARGPAVRALRTRLAAEGYDAPAGHDPQVFDARLAAALADFQAHHGLAAGGSLNADTRAALDVPAADRLDQIEANLERWRWLPRQLPADRVEVDIAAATARLIQDGAETLAMKTVVGDPKHHTPSFASHLDSVVFNPPWNVPASIAQKEILPKAAKDPGYLAREDFVWVEGRLQQRAGPKSALGKVKFDLPSDFGVYLHDTPARSGFARRVRALSHGCMRLEKPRELAAALLAPQGWTPERVDSAIDGGKTATFRIAAKTPLFVLYWTAVADADGRVDFRPDVYGWDQELADALAERRRAEAAKHPDQAESGDLGP